MSNKFAFIITAFALLPFILAGCERPATSSNESDSHSHDHSHADVKLSLKETLEKVNSLATKIGEGFADGESEKAHGPLHEIGHQLESAEKLVADSTLAEDAKKTLADAVKELLDGYTEVDAKMHDKNDGVEYSEVKDKIESALKVVNQAIPTL